MAERQPIRALEWLTRRKDGESPALIAWRDGVSEHAVKRATDPWGPFPRATRQLGRTELLEELSSERVRRWVLARQRGEPVSAIAQREKVARQIISRRTLPWGPFPAHEVVREWVRARRSGRSVESVAVEYGAPRALVRKETAPWGRSTGTARGCPRDSWG